MEGVWGQPLTSSDPVPSASASPGTMLKGPTVLGIRAVVAQLALRDRSDLG